MTQDSYDTKATTASVAGEAMKLLDRNPYHTAKSLCEALGLDYSKRGNYLNVVKQRWKNMLRKSRGDFVDLGDHLSCGKARVGVGFEPCEPWRKSGFRGGMWTFTRKGWGSLKWFPSTGTVLWSVVRPFNVGRVLQLLAFGFSHTGVVTDLKDLDRLFASVRFRGAHRVLDVGRRLPYVKVDLFRRSNGVEIVLGDRSHPTCVEVKYRYMPWAERNEELLERFLQVLATGNHVKPDRGVGRV